MWKAGWVGFVWFAGKIRNSKLSNLGWLWFKGFVGLNMVLEL
jgi:hypothetical protein